MDAWMLFTGVFKGQDTAKPYVLTLCSLQVGPVMFESKVFKKETIEFSKSPDATKEDILRVSLPI